jgi:hypothetical protein
MRALPHQDEAGRPAILDYQPVRVDGVDWHEFAARALRNLWLLVTMLACVTIFLFLELAGMGMMVMAVAGVGWLGPGILSMVAGLGALLLAAWCLDSMR